MTGGARKSTNFEVLCGGGATWFTQTDYNHDVPANQYKAGHDAHSGHTLYLGRCNINGELYLGKIGGNFYTSYQDTEFKNCNPHDIIICA